MPVLEHRLGRVPQDVAAANKVTLIPVRDAAIGRAFNNGASVRPGMLETDLEGALVMPHTYPSINGGIVVGSNGSRAGVLKDILVAEPLISPEALMPNSTEARLTQLFGPPLKNGPFSVNDKPTQSGLAIAEVARGRKVHMGPIDAVPHLLDRGTILLARDVTDSASHILRDNPLSDGPDSPIGNDKPKISERKYHLTTVDDLLLDAGAYMKNENAKPRDQRARPGKTVTQRQAIRHILEQLSYPEPINRFELKRREVAKIPLNVDPEAMYQQLAAGLGEKSDIVQEVNRGIDNRLAEGKDSYIIYFDAVINLADRRWRELTGEQQANTIVVDNKQHPVAPGEVNFGDGVLGGHGTIRRVPGYRGILNEDTTSESHSLPVTPIWRLEEHFETDTRAIADMLGLPQPSRAEILTAMAGERQRVLNKGSHIHPPSPLQVETQIKK